MDCQTNHPHLMHSQLTQSQNLHFVLLELCARPEYVEMIRHEIEAAGELDYDSINQLPILDSFIKESVRSNPLDKGQSYHT